MRQIYIGCLIVNIIAKGKSICNIQKKINFVTIHSIIALKLGKKMNFKALIEKLRCKSNHPAAELLS